MMGAWNSDSDMSSDTDSDMYSQHSNEYIICPRRPLMNM